MAVSSTIPPYPSSIDWYDGTVLIFPTRSRSSLFKFVPFGRGYNDGSTPTMAVAFSVVIFGALIMRCSISPLFAVELLLLDVVRYHRL